MNFKQEDTLKICLFFKKILHYRNSWIFKNNSKVALRSWLFLILVGSLGNVRLCDGPAKWQFSFSNCFSHFPKIFSSKSPKPFVRAWITLFPFFSFNRSYRQSAEANSKRARNELRRESYGKRQIFLTGVKRGWGGMRAGRKHFFPFHSLN